MKLFSFLFILLSVISVNELTLKAREVNAFRTQESYLPLAVGFLLLTLPLYLRTRRLEEENR